MDWTLCRLGALVVGATLTSSCVEAVDAPGLDALEPSWGWNGESTDVVLLGEDFYPGVAATGADAFDIDRQFDAWIEVDGTTVPLEGVSLVDLGQLRARVPAGLPAGRHDVGIRTPNGAEDVLEAGFTVSDSRGDHLLTQVDTLTHRALALARVGVSLVDPENTPVPEALDIRVRVVGVEDPLEVWFEETLDDQEWDPGLPGIRGTLGSGGSGFVAVTRDTPGDVWLEVSPDDSASTIAGASQFLAFTAGGVASVEVSQESDSLVPTAGESFPLRLTLRDDAGNPTDGAIASLTLLERCSQSESGFRRTVVFADEYIVPDAYLTTATGQPGCMVNGFEVVGLADGSPLEGASPDILVEPGSAAVLGVTAFPGVVEAGAEPLVVVVEVQDEWGNATETAADTLTLSDTEGGLSDFSCRPLLDGQATCDAWVTRASDDVRVLATTSGGLTGESEPLTVLPGPAMTLTVSTDPPSIAAGDVFDMVLRALDAWGNTVQMNPTGSDAPDVFDAAGPVSCAWVTRVGTDGDERFACLTTHAEPAKVLDVRLASGATGTSPPFEVTNGALAKATVDIGGITSLTAGDPLDISVRTTDAWDNPYTLQTVSSVGVSDKAGEFVAESVTLDADGIGTIRLRPTVAWAANQLDALDAGTVLGRSAPFDVTAGSPSTLVVEPPRTWVAVNEYVDVKVTVADAYGNAAPGFSGSVVIESEQEAITPATVTAFTGGEATVAIRWLEIAFADALVANGGGLTGRSDTVDALTDCGLDGPTADLVVGGDTDHVTCRVAGVTPATTLDASGSTAGLSPLEYTHFSQAPGTWTRVAGTSTTGTWEEVGGWIVRAVVADAAGCMAEASARLWVGDNDGQPAGPVVVSTASSSLVAGSATLGTTAVNIAATDCAGDPAVAGTIGVRADLGLLSSGTSTLTSSGAGLELSLDAAGTGNVTWSVVTTAHDGSATVHAGTATGSAHGSTSADVTGEFAPPTVLAVLPAGSRSGVFSEVEILFSEPMLPASITGSTIGLTDPTGVPLSDITVTSAEDIAIVSLDTPQDAGAGAWSLGIGSDARDAGGNRLDGTWSGGASAFQLTFGLVADTAPDITDCIESTVAIRPDGDDGLGDESDDLEVSLQASGTPAWWETLILGPEGELVHLERTAATSSSATATWDGRDLDGFIVPAGDYTAVLTPLDSSWNEGARCTRNVGVRHRITEPTDSP